MALSTVSILKKKVALLQNKDLIVHPTQKLVCIFFLYDMYRNDHIASNPFASVFTYLVVSLKLFKKSNRNLRNEFYAKESSEFRSKWSH